MTIVGVAALLVGLVWLTSPRSGASPASFESGEAFFPGFTDPDAATSLEVVEFDQQALVARPFKVVNQQGRWTIPSHESYPADGGSRLATIAAAVMALEKDAIASENVSDQERCGVLDPLDETLPTATGRGTRITVRGAGERVLADIITGHAVEGRPQFRYVRAPESRRIYIARIDRLDVSTRFEDWIERNLLQVDRREIDRIAIRNYMTDPATGRVQDRGVVSLTKTGEDQWTLDGMRPRETLTTFAMNLLVTKLVDLSIEGVRRKPPTVAALLAGSGGALTRQDADELRNRGFYITPDGRLQSNQGEVLVHTSSGIFYVLRFGEVAHGVAPAATAADQRYLFISVSFDAAVGQGRIRDDTRKRLELLRARFSPWYYVVSNDSFRKIRLSRDELLASR